MAGLLWLFSIKCIIHTFKWTKKVDKQVHKRVCNARHIETFTAVFLGGVRVRPDNRAHWMCLNTSLDLFKRITGHTQAHHWTHSSASLDALKRITGLVQA